MWPAKSIFLRIVSNFQFGIKEDSGKGFCGEAAMPLPPPLRYE